MSTMLKTSLIAAASAALLGATGSAGAAEYANVVSATPVTGSVSAPRQDCFQGEQVVQAPAFGRRRRHRRDRRRRDRQPVRPWLRPRRRHRPRRRRGLGDRQQRRGQRQSAGDACRCAAAAPSTATRTASSATTSSTSTTASATRRACRAIPGPRLAIDIRPAGNAPLDRVGPPATSYGAVPPAYAQTAPSYDVRACVLRRGAGLLRRASGVLRAGAGLLLGAVLRRAGGDRPRHRLLDRQHVAPRLSPRLARRPPLALSDRASTVADRKRGPRAPFRLPTRAARVSVPRGRRPAPSRASCSSSPTRCRTRRRP